MIPERRLVSAAAKLPLLAIASIIVTDSTGQSPAALSADSMIASAPS